MMKRIFTISVLMLAFAMNAVAYDDEKIVERHSFRLLYPDDGNVYTGNDQSNKNNPHITLGGTIGNSIQTIEQQYNWNSITTQVSYKSWLHNEDRFLLEPTDNPTAYALDLTNVNGGALPEGWRCVQENDEVHQYPNSYSSGARVLTDFLNGGRGLYWRKNIVEYGHQDAFPLSLFKGSYSLTFRMAKRGDNPNGYTLKILKILNDNSTAEVTSHSYETPSTVSASQGDANLGNIQEETLTFNIEEAGNYIIRFIANNPDSDNNYHGYILASCQLTRNGASWQITKNARTDKGFGLVNVSGSPKGLKILNLKAGDVVRFAYFLNSSSSQDRPSFKASEGCITGRHQSWSNASVTPLAEGSVINGSFDIFVDSDGDLDIICPSGILIREVTIALAECPRASYIIEPVAGTAGYKYTITGTGILKEKHPALPYITTRFGNDNDMTIVKDFGNGVLAASSIVDPSNNLDIENGNVKLSAIYKKRYQNSSSHYVDYGQVASNYQYDSNAAGYDNNPYDSQYNSETEAAIKALAQEEANSLKGREWTVFEATNFWNEGHDWGGRPANSPGNNSGQSSSGSKYLSYKWEDDFNSIYPQYGSYYYFFPSVKGKLKVKFYCEGGDEHMPLWMKLDGQGNFVGADAQDSHTQVKVKKYGESDFTSSAFGCNSVLNTNIYEYEAQLERGGVYYLCSNPTLVSREHPVIRLMSYEFIPEFLVSPLYKVVDNGTANVEEACIIKGGRFDDLTVDKNRQITINGENDHPEVKFLGNVTGADFDIVNGTEADEQILKITNITYKDEDEKCNKGGAIVVNLHCSAGQTAFVLTVAYSAAEAKMDADNNRKGTAKNNNNHTIEVKKWDFFSGDGDGKNANGDPTNLWDLGKYGSDDGTRFVAGEDNTAWKAKSRLFKEVHKADGLTYDWVMEYLDETDPSNPKEQVFKSVFDMEGDNADMIHETAGLLFHTETYLMGINNENPAPSTTTFNDRYIGLIGDNHFNIAEHPRSFIIPNLTAGDRIVIKMGRYGNDAQGEPHAHLTITGANDAINNPINNDYVIGGSGVDGNGNITDLSKPYGEYHFISTGGNFELKAVDVPLLKIYSIEIYRNAANNNADILTENKVKGTDENNTREILYTEADTDTKSIGLQLNYRGLNESTAPLNHVRMTGNIEQNDITVTSSGDTHTYSTPKPTKATGAQFANGKFGAFKTRIAVKTLQSGAYVTDYADCMVPVGFREKLDYPNTWDFTDLREKYVTVKENNVVTNGIDAMGNEKPVADGDLTIWNNWSLTAAPENFDGNLFVSGGQLYAGSKMFDETRGLGIVHNGSNGILSLTASAESGEGESREGAISISNVDSYGFIVPQVAAGQAVYVHATPISGQAQSAQFAIGEGSPQAFTYTNGNTFAMKMADGASTSDVKLCFQGYEVNKIAVATDEKTVNDEGWNTESRARAIDPSLLPYMTGKDFRTYAVFGNPSAVDGVNVINLTRIDGVTTGDDATGTGNAKIIGAATDGSTNACIIRYVGDKGGENIFGDGRGFHLFVPDMHDDTPSDMSNNQLKAQLSATGDNKKVPRQSGDYFNYAFTNKFKYVDGDGEQLQGREGVYTGKQAFYLIMKDGATSSGNQAYLSLDTKVPAARLVLFIEGEKGDSEATGIATVEDNSVGGENARFYNLSGQQLSGKPNRSGLYIVNGKKVSIKNK